MKYTKEILEPLVRDSLSIAEVMRKIGFKCLNGGEHTHLTRQIKKFGINTSHLLGRARNRSVGHKGGSERLDWTKILIKNRLCGRKETSSRLRRAMVESGIEEKCGTCELGSEWNDKVLVLQISHKDGDSLNNEKSNLHFECPNCHSQTDDFGGRSAGKKRFGPVV